MPVGVAPPGATVVTVAVKVTAWPATAGFTDDARPTLVASGLTVSVTVGEVLSPKPPVPKKEAAAASGCRRPGDTGMVARPAALTAELSTVVPSRTKTVLTSVPACEVTLAVRSTVCPKTAVGADVASVVVVVPAGAGAVGTFSSTPTVPEEAFAATRSTRPSPLRSAAATPRGSLPPVGEAHPRLARNPNVPSPLPANTERLPVEAPN